MMQSKKFAVTGGIGSGKSAVCKILKEKGYAVFSCDEISRELWEMEDYRNGLAELFPVCTSDGGIDKRKLAAYVFVDQAALARLDAYAHPRIMKELLRRMEDCEVSFAEVPLLFEGGYETLFDGVIAVRRWEASRLAAVILRDGLTEKAVKLRMERQLDPALLETKNCIILENNGTLEELEQGVETFLQNSVDFGKNR